MTKRRLRRGLLGAALALLLLAILAWGLRARILTGVGDYLVVEDPLQPADIIFVLNGDPNARPFRAAELHQQGLAPVIVIARVEGQPIVDLGLVRNETDISVGVMEALGVPAGSIVELTIPGGVTSTFDEARLLRDYAAAADLHSVILVTSAFHTRRAAWVFRRELAGLPVSLMVAAAPHHGFDQGNWWQSENGLITLNNEYIKLMFYYWNYK